jgi:hypothetical protein
LRASATLVRSNWLREVTKEYRHGSLDKVRHTHIESDAFAFSKPKAATVERYLVEQLQKAHIRFEDNAVYALMVPVGSAVLSDAGGTPEGFHHELKKTQQLDAWAVIQPDDKAFDLDTYTVVIAHETAEAITHTAGHGVSGRAFDRKQSIVSQSPWLIKGGEDADACARARILEGGYVYPRIFSNHAARTDADDPCLPKASMVFNTAPAARVPSLPIAEWTTTHSKTATIHLVGWSTSNDCNLRWTGSVEAVDVKKNLAGMIKPDVSPAKLDLGHNVPAEITVTIPAGAPAKSWGIVLVTSKRPDAPRGTDKQHDWYYGVFYDP